MKSLATGIPISREIRGAGTLLLAYSAMLIATFFVLRSPMTMIGGNQLSTDRAVFATLNAGTLTGFQYAIAPDDFRLPGQLALLALTLLVAIALLTFGGMCVARIARRDISDHQIFLWSLSLPILLASLIAVFYTPTGIAFHAAIMLGLCAVANSGIVLTSHVSPDWRFFALLLPASVAGSLGVVSLIEIFGKGRISAHTRITFVIAAALYLLTALLVLAVLPDHSLPLATALALDSRTYGLPFDSLSSLPRVTAWLLVPIMFIGGGSGGTAGGVKVTTVHLASKNNRALQLIFLFGLLIFVCWLGLIITAPQIPVDRLLFISISAASNVGLAHDPLSLVGSPLYLLSAEMLVGRMLPLLFLYNTARTRAGEIAIG